MKNDYEYDDIYVEILLEDLKEKINSTNDLNFIKKDIYNAFHRIATQVADQSFYLDCLHKSIPQKYKKFNPKSGENPFFSIEDIKPTPKDYQSAKKRMEDLLPKQDSSEASPSS